jgi:DNA polymerase
MAMTREDMLRELELLPAWKLREPNILGVDVKATEVKTAEVVAKVQAAELEAVVLSQPELVEPVEQAQPLTEAMLPAVESTQAQVSQEPDYQEEYLQQLQQEPAYITELIEAEQQQQPSLHAERVSTIQKMDWQTLQSCVKDCQACHLAATRTQAVFGVGDPNADWLIVGEAPGAEEDLKGEPFVGQAGKLLDNMLAAIQLKRGDNVYIANVLKCRPPENRDPRGEEVLECDPFLKRQVELIQPKLIIALGKFASQSLLQTEDKIADLRGRLHQYNNVPVIVTYHPAYLLRNLADKAKAWEDLCFAKSTMQRL